MIGETMSAVERYAGRVEISNFKFQNGNLKIIMRWKLLLPGIVLLAVIGLVRAVIDQPLKGIATEETARPAADLRSSVEAVNIYFVNRWATEKLTPAKQADELTVLRRITLALMGTVPSLEELRAFELDSGPDRLQRWTARYLHDPRFSDYFAERLARGFVGIEGGQFIVYRRDRFVAWLSDQLKANRPYNELVHEMISGTGLWTDQPETNFVMAGYDDGQGFNENKLAGRAVRAFLGQRIDCAQCHDHPFDHWKQNEFAGLAAHFGQVKLTVVGVQEDRQKKFEAENRETLEKTVVEPSVPFHPEWEPSEGNRRERLAVWITHPQNRRLERAVVNRVWGLVFGRSWIDPVDDLPDPSGEEVAASKVEWKHSKVAIGDGPDLLDLLGADFREHRYDLRRLIEVIVASRPFLLESRRDNDDTQQLDQLKSHFAIFTLTRLRPEQVIGALLQAASLKTIDQNSHLIPRTMKFFRSRDFVEEYGDLGENELEERAGTIPQALLRMNGNLVKDAIDATPLALGAPGRIASMSPDDRKCLELCYLVCLTRRPTDQEAEHFLPLLQENTGNRRGRAVEDIYWTLSNSPEFAWNH